MVLMRVRGESGNRQVDRPRRPSLNARFLSASRANAKALIKVSINSVLARRMERR